MKAVYIYNKTSGTGSVVRKIQRIITSLKETFDEVDVVESTSPEHFIKTCKEACYKYLRQNIRKNIGGFGKALRYPFVQDAYGCADHSCDKIRKRFL